MDSIAIARTGSRSSTREIVLKALLVCGILAALVYIGGDMYAASVYPGYSYVDQQVSELSAVGAPTQALWGVIGRVYGVLAIAFGVGVALWAGKRRMLRVAGILLVAATAIGQFWTPMSQRGSVGSLNDTLHLVFTAIVVPMLMLVIAFGSGVRGRGFRIYSIATIVASLAAGTVIATVAVPAIAANVPTPGMGLVERVTVYSPMVWMAALSIALLTERRPGSAGHREGVS